jgi:citrate synthase
MGTGGRGGLEDIVVSTSDICFIDGREGRLVYRGYDVNDLVEHSSFEEVIFLLWHGGLPSKKELVAHTKALNATANRKLPAGIVSLLKALPKKTTPMEVLRTGISALSAYDPDAADNSKDATARKALRLTAQMPTLVAAWDRIRKGKAPVAPNPKLNLASNFLYMLTGKRASPLAEKTFDVALILHADHEFNASTFAARVTAATMSDLHSAIVSAIGALKGPLHGGANEQVMLMVRRSRRRRTRRRRFARSWPITAGSWASAIASIASKTRAPSICTGSRRSSASRRATPARSRSSTPWSAWSASRRRSSPTSTSFPALRTCRWASRPISSRQSSR